MAEVTLFIRDTGGDFSQGFGPGEDWADSASEDLENFGTFSQIRVSVYLDHNNLSGGTGTIFLRIFDGGSLDETVSLTAFSSLQRNNPQWFEVSFTDGPYSLNAGSRLSFHVRVIGGNKTGRWRCQDFNGSLDVLVQSYGTELTAPNKPTTPAPTDTGTGIILQPTLSWEVG